MNLKAPLFKQNLVISIQVNNLSESGASPHEPQSTLIQPKSGVLILSPYPLVFLTLITLQSQNLPSIKI
jgi:hypothetical protein